MKTRIAFISLMALFAVGAASAQVRDRTFEISPYAGYLFGGEFSRGSNVLFNFDVDADDAATYGARLGYNLNSTFQLELQISHTETEFVTGDDDGNLFGRDFEESFGDLDIDYVLGYMTFNFGRRRAVPYITLGAGAARLDPAIRGARDETRFTASLGGGVKTFFTPNFGLRFDGRGYVTSLGDNDDDDFCGGFFDDCDSDRQDWLTNGELSLGLVFAF